MAEAKMAWLRAVTEGLVIVASILLAFGIDAAWEERGIRTAERESLRALEEDFEAAASILESQILVHDSAVAAAEALLELTGPRAVASLADSLAALIPPLMRLPHFAPPVGSLDALLGSGSLSDIRSEELKASLAQFPSVLAEMNRTQRYSDDEVFGMLIPLLNSRVPMRTFGLRGRGESRFNGDPASLLRSLEFENAVQNRLMSQEFALDSAQRTKVLVEAILRMIREELDR